MPHHRPHTAVASADAVDAKITQAPVKPRLRGWIHAVMAPLALAVALVLVVGAPTLTGKVTTAIFNAATIILFGTSAVYHRGSWSPQVTAVLRRLNHSNIFLVLVGTYTPLPPLLLHACYTLVDLVLVRG